LKWATVELAVERQIPMKSSLRKLSDKRVSRMPMTSTSMRPRKEESKPYHELMSEEVAKEVLKIQMY
jgi:hypothetical protein